jgi:hypothetical protein
MSQLEHYVLSCHFKTQGIYMAPITVYIDDSGTHLGTHVAVAAAWISPVPTWIRFVREWENVKREYGFSCFHASEYFARNSRSEFANWDEEKWNKLIRRLSQLCFQRASVGLGVVVRRADYEELVPDEARLRMGKFHYTWAVRVLIGLIERWRENRTEEPMEYIFDYLSNDEGQREKRQEIEVLFEHFSDRPDSMKRYGMYRGCNSFKDRRVITPLQASDFLAWLVFQRGWYEVTDRIPPHEIAKTTYDDFTRTEKVYVSMATREQIKEAVAQTSQYPEDQFWEPRVNPKGSFPYAAPRQQTVLHVS